MSPLKKLFVEIKEPLCTGMNFLSSHGNIEKS